MRRHAADAVEQMGPQAELADRVGEIGRHRERAPLPDHVNGTGSGEQFWRHQGWAVRQPAVPAAGECLDMTDIGTALAKRTGLLRKYNEAINRGAAGMALKGQGFDYSLAPDEAHGRDAVWNAVAKAASHESWVSARLDPDEALASLTPGSSVGQGFDHLRDRNLALIRGHRDELERAASSSFWHERPRHGNDG